MTKNVNQTKNFHSIRKNHLFALALVPMFTVLMCVAAKISIPTPIVPITLQVTIAVLSGLLLGARLGFLSQLLYLLMGLVGLPVFAQGGGIGYVTTLTFGYLVGFAFCALAGGFLADLLDRKSVAGKHLFVGLAVISFISLIVCYFFGMAYMYGLSHFYTGFTGQALGVHTIIGFNVLPFAKDIILSLLAAELARRLWRFRYRGTADRNAVSDSGNAVQNQISQF